MNTFKKKFKLNLIYVNAEQLFISKLKNVTDPEKKEKLLEIYLLNFLKNTQKK